MARKYSNIWDASYPFWCAQYKLIPPKTYVDDPWTDTKGFGPWKDCAILQYSSKGRLTGYDGDLDLDKAYIKYVDQRCIKKLHKLLVKERFSPPYVELKQITLDKIKDI